MEASKYRLNYEGFYEKLTNQISINMGKIMTTQGAPWNAYKNSILFFLLVESFEEEIQLFDDFVDTIRG